MIEKLTRAVREASDAQAYLRVLELAQHGEKAVPAALAMIDDVDATIRGRGYGVLENIEGAVVAARELLLGSLNDVDEGNCKTVAKTLIYADVPLVDVFARCKAMAVSPQPRDQAASAYVAVCLAEVDAALMNECVAMVAAACRHGDVSVRRHGYGALLEANTLLAKVTKEVVRVVEDPDIQVRIVAAGRVGELGAKAKAAVPALITALADADEHLRSAAAWSLGHVGKSALDAVDALAAALADLDFSVRLNAAEALGRLGKEAQAALPAVLAALENDHTATDVLVISAWKMSDDRATLAQPLLRLLEHGPEDLRVIAAEYLGKLGGAARDALPALERAADSADDSLKYVAAIAFRKINKPWPPVGLDRTAPDLRRPVARSPALIQASGKTC